MRLSIAFKALAALLALAAVPARAAPAPPPAVTAVPGRPLLQLAGYDFAPLGYQLDEYFISGTATSYALPRPPEANGVWNAVPAATAPYATRVVVVRPSQGARFNGTVLVEWLNVSLGQDTAVDWRIAHREMLRRGYAYVGVSAQRVGVDGGEAVAGPASPLKRADPARYGSLSHPGDAWSYDIFSQVAVLLKRQGASGLLGPLVPRRVIGIGDSQSAMFLTTYVNAVDRLARVYDGFLIHSRFGGAAAIDGARPEPNAAAALPFVRFRPDLRVPVLTLITETDLLGARMPGYQGARRPDDRFLRVWEVPGTAHADNYLVKGAFGDSGQQPVDDLAKIFVPTRDMPQGRLAVPINAGMPHHYVAQAALAALNDWVMSGRAPPSVPALTLAGGASPASEPRLALDARGLAMGGVRTPWVDVPTIRLSGRGDPGSFLGLLGGSSEAMTKAELDRLYPHGKVEYMRRFATALDDAIRAGHVLRDDRHEILAIAAINYDTAP